MPRQSPPQFTALFAVLIVLGITAGIVATASTQARRSSLTELRAANEQLIAAEDLRVALAGAEVAAGTAFNTTDPMARARTSDRYDLQVAAAQSALARMSDRPDLALPERLQEYTTLIETARGYLREKDRSATPRQLIAADRIREQLLPAANVLHDTAQAKVADLQRRMTASPTSAVLPGLLALAALVLAQIWLARRVRRVVNPGLVLATLAAIALVVWPWIAADTAADHVDGNGEPAALDALGEARAAALTARGNELHLLLADEGNLPSRRFADDYAAQVCVVHQRLRPLASAGAARSQAIAWLDRNWSDCSRRGSVHPATATIRVRNQDGDDHAPRALDEQLAGVIDDLRLRVDDHLTAGDNALTGVDAGVGGLGAGVVVAAAAGVWVRMREFR